MNCPKCRNHETSVVDSRATDTDVRRRRECDYCNERFSTLEILADSVELVAALRLHSTLSKIEKKMNRLRKIFAEVDKNGIGDQKPRS